MHKNQTEKIFQSIKARSDFRRTRSERIADWMTTHFGSFTFLLLNLFFFLAWLAVNTNQIEGITAFDPFPFNLLTTFVSLEAIVLAIFVLISQNRNSKIDDLREETHLQLDIISEQEITKLMRMIALLLEKEGIDLSEDPELKKMILPVNEEEIEEKLKKEIF
ncbi:hypothetical protein A2643_01135 [Candidatus Nomurabacteria bacterium RIFCSPHIGHO2_01_FULL_39_220]|uniref:DUF1003 domain-containing protein n=1 Tax=Candidatus Nomurabacteria bacterium RIFCSPLOWO2_02_FULL_40_67 TaxID=1801787 RepID=A0A1F6Y2L4_9BACT|nr:MAG: hypothetical protein UU01_C0005G0013 [Parcubacteria group bacterium GW2011_GWA2_40_37]KKS10945.1 MAG: hypothetical protein UU66_C0035G0006 [Parcubacteria group bacterium GW2011_GWB1_41_5]OGI61576.1 MAG: hypothetical protein A2W12_03030 [Candidatus Nomurabacteria bacterium RBG_16_40_11]OGI71022.1 MAG: hypothetical protein A2643_01135 [Candidatus Nomurabacteria bacterium RIFCSPHIGHO2_01_FULL_39_220]OGI72481.1 MAG: hypothetical protein A2W56_01105 [Candidatus Nomurabacteria bacterium RIFCS